MNFYKLYILFWTFAILGWIIEVVYSSIYDRRLENRGFLLGPYCPIYGFGALIMILLSPYRDNPILCFLLALVFCTILEYFTGYLLEKLFKIRWWDYSNYKFNINGRVCLVNALAFGALGVIVTRYVYPLCEKVINSFSDKTIMTIFIFVFVITFLDILISVKAMNSVKGYINKNLKNLKNKDATKDIKKVIHDKIKNINFLERRIIKRIHLYQLKHQFLSNYNLWVMVIFIIIGIIVGLLVGLVFSNLSLIYTILLSVSISILVSFLFIKWRKE